MTIDSETSLSETSLVVCSLQDTFYAIESRYVKSIRPHINITLVPGCPAFVLGVIHINGNIESVLDLRQLLQLEKVKPHNQQKILLFDTGTLKSGLLVDSVEDIITVAEDSLQQPLSSLPEEIKQFVSNEFTSNNRHIVVLDMEKLSSKILGQV